MLDPFYVLRYVLQFKIHTVISVQVAYFKLALEVKGTKKGGARERRCFAQISSKSSKEGQLGKPLVVDIVYRCL